MDKYMNALLVAGLLLAGVPAFAELEVEPVGRVEILPSQYPSHWVMAHDVAFFHMMEGKVFVLDPLQEDLGEQVKGMMTASFIGAYLHSDVRNEHYVVETFYSRGGRGGERTDVVTIYDPATLKVEAEIEIPAKRITGMPKTTMNGLIDNDRFMAIYNFTPTQSVSIVDLEQRTFVGEVRTPGCGFAIPTGQRSFTSICSDGTFLTTALNDTGAAAGTSRTEKLFDANNDPVFETAPTANGIAYFLTFTGEVLPLDVSRDNVSAGARWSLAQNDEEKSWRPGGMNLITADSSGLGYVLMHPDGGEGTHKTGGSEVWVYDLAKAKRVKRMTLTNWGVSLGTTGEGDDRLLTVTNAEMGVDVYRSDTGEMLRTLIFGAETPFITHGAN